MEAMRKLAGWVSLALCLQELQAEFNIHLHPQPPAFFGSPCAFPFRYDDVVYHYCTAVRSDYSWCSLDKVFRGRWRYCSAKDPPMCTFPFKFRSRLFQTCIKEGYIFNRSWCSLTSDYDADGKWKQCSPYDRKTKPTFQHVLLQVYSMHLHKVYR